MTKKDPYAFTPEEAKREYKLFNAAFNKPKAKKTAKKSKSSKKK